MNKVYIEHKRNDYLNIQTFTSALGFKNLGSEVVFFNADELYTLPITKDTIVHGNIGTVVKALGMLGIKKPATLNAHIELPQYIHREVKETTVKEILDGRFEYPFHVKPLYETKLFTGGIINHALELCDKLDNSLPVIISKLVDIQSEYRCFVNSGVLVDCKRYFGSFEVLPDFTIVRAAIYSYKNQPAAYSLDFAVLTDGTTELIEINDAFSLGCYGLDPFKYACMIESRWNELTTL